MGIPVRILVALSGALLVPAQTALRVDSDMVLVPTSVLDRKERLVLNLARSQFHVYEDRRERPLAHFALEEGPVSVGLLFDASRSMRQSMGDARAAVRAVLDAARPDDEFALIAFNDKPQVRCPFDGETAGVERAMAGLEAKGGTSLADALLYAMRYVKQKAQHTRRALIVLSDAGERDSRHTWTEVRQAAREADTRLYLLLLQSAIAEEPTGQEMLRGIAEETGGRIFEIGSGREFRQAAERLELHWEYVLGFRPGHEDRDGRYHRLEVRLEAAPDQRKLRVFWRKGYVATP